MTSTQNITELSDVYESFDSMNLTEETLEQAMARGVIFYDPIAGFQVNPLTGGRMGTGIDPNFIAQRAMQAEQDAAARVKPKMAMGGEIPVRQNQGGVSELDLRAKGGYIPVGIKEKADDVPAMLSKNEFVFTADAVRGAGGGDINKGAQKMYKLMKSLEKKIKKTKVA